MVPDKRSAMRSSWTACVRAAWRGCLQEGRRGLSGGDFSFRMTHPVATQPVLDGALRLAESTELVDFFFFLWGVLPNNRVALSL